MATPEDLARYREMWADELGGAALYRVLAETTDDHRRGIFESLAEAEERHAEHWARLLREGGVTDLRTPRLPLRVRVIRFLARRLGTDAVLPLVLRAEARDADRYQAVAEAPAAMAAQEAVHGRVVAALRGGEAPGGRVAAAEGRHRIGAGGALRASVFGVNDGLVSNLSLVMGVAGGTTNSRFVVLAGVAGLVAGAFSMAAGEWVSVRSQRELFENELRIEREELAMFPEEEREELELIYQAKGIEPDVARRLVDRIMRSPEVALDTLAREELGLDPGELGSPWVAAGSSFVAFALGALVPLLPYLVGSGAAAFVVSAVVSALALFVVGATISVFTGRAPLRAGARMVIIGGAAAGTTFVIGKLVGVGVS
ncbi:MAG: VIT1/CCC1 transporter family protein [Acidimicrobiia bacterium]|nr:VIT1/CCC1 transporter family protein [Acidimicrobiia bacterium]